MDAQPISFAEWGEQWMDLIMTPELIEDSLRRMVQPTIRIAMPAVQGAGQAAVGSVTRTNAGDMHREIHFAAPLLLDFTLSIGLAGLYAEEYQIKASAPLTLILRALPLLRLHLEAPPLQPEQIEVRSEGSGLQLVQQFVDLDGQLKNAIASEINQQLEGSAEQRTVDVLALVRQSGVL